MLLGLIFFVPSYFQIRSYGPENILPLINQNAGEMRWLFLVAYRKRL